MKIKSFENLLFFQNMFKIFYYDVMELSCVLVCRHNLASITLRELSESFK